MAIVERCPKCGLFTNLKRNNGRCVHCNTDVDDWWNKHNVEMDKKENAGDTKNEGGRNE